MIKILVDPDHQRAQIFRGRKDTPSRKANKVQREVVKGRLERGKIQPEKRKASWSGQSSGSSPFPRAFAFQQAMELTIAASRN
ncbi:MAG: hypothetical protein CMF59_05775 [Leptospiraceae bacterium]|nr:hypothetical protein [Leptospiraceae bacterium]